VRIPRSLILAIDTAIVAGTNALVLIVSARILRSDSLTSLTMAQLLVVTAVGLQRATILTPAFASQRAAGRSVVPMRWALLVSVPLSLAWSAVMPFMTPSFDLNYFLLFSISFAVCLPILVQDLLRFCLFTRLRPTSALVSDATFLVVFCLAVWALLLRDETSWTSLFAAWGASAAAASAIALCLVLVAGRSLEEVQAAKLRDVLRLGKWSGSDAALSGAANLLPMVVSTLALGSPAAAIYRVLQTANGPFNILSATFLTSAGMDAWKLASPDEVKGLRVRAIKQTFVLTIIACVFYALAYPVILLLAGLEGEEAARVAIILGFSGVLGAATIPINAAASAMGYQRVGFFVRVVVVVSAIGVSALALWGAWIPWNDPVGVVALISSVAGLVGWTLGYERGYRRENL